MKSKENIPENIKPNLIHIQSRLGSSTLCEDAQPATGALLAHQVHLFLVPVVDSELGRRGGGLGEHFAFAQAPAVGEELLLEVFGDPSLDDDVAAVALERNVMLA